MTGSELLCINLEQNKNIISKKENISNTHLSLENITTKAPDQRSLTLSQTQRNQCRHGDMETWSKHLQALNKATLSLMNTIKSFKWRTKGIDSSQEINCFVRWLEKVNEATNISATKGAAVSPHANLNLSSLADRRWRAQRSFSPLGIKSSLSLPSSVGLPPNLSWAFSSPQALPVSLTSLLF